MSGVFVLSYAEDPGDAYLIKKKNALQAIAAHLI